MDGRWMGGLPQPGSPQAFQTRSGLLSIPPHLKVNDSSHKSRRIEELSTYPFSLRWP